MGFWFDWVRLAGAACPSFAGRARESLSAQRAGAVSRASELFLIGGGIWLAFGRVR